MMTGMGITFNNITPYISRELGILPPNLLLGYFNDSYYSTANLKLIYIKTLHKQICTIFLIRITIAATY